MNKLLLCTVLLLGALAGNIYCRKQRQMPPPPRELIRVLEINATEIQHHVDQIYVLASMWLLQPSNQEQITQYLAKAINITKIIGSLRIREVANEIVNDVLSSIDNIKDRTVETLYNISNFTANESLLINNPRSIFSMDLLESDIPFAIDVSKLFIKLRQFIAKELKSLKEMVSCKFSKYILTEITRIEESDLYNLEDIHYLLTKGLEFFEDHFGSFLAKIESSSAALDLVKHMINSRTNQNIERTVRTLAATFAEQLNRLNFRSLSGRARELIDLVLDNFEKLRPELVEIALNSTAQYFYLLLEENFKSTLRHNTTINATFVNQLNLPPFRGIVISDRLDRIRVDLGEKIVYYRDNTIREIKNFARDVLQSLTIRNIPYIDDEDFGRVSNEVFVEIMRNARQFFDSLNTIYHIYSESTERHWPDPPSLWSI